jgi:hypothetical protein
MKSLVLARKSEKVWNFDFDFDFDFNEWGCTFHSGLILFCVRKG